MFLSHYIFRKRLKENDIALMNIKFGTKFIIALSDIFKKIARTGRFYFEKWHPVTCNLFK
jgi:hypothetical protein